MSNKLKTRMTYFDFQKKFATIEQVVSYYISVRYPKGLTCNHCGSTQVYPRAVSPRVFDCEGCRNTFSVFTGTVFEKSSTDLRKWMYAFHLFLNGKKGISGLQLQREIGVTYKTAWRMLKQIRIAMGNEKTPMFEAICEIDETYVGGKPRKENKRNGNDKNKRGRGTKKTPVVAVVSRSENKVFARVALPNKQGKKLTGKQLLEIIDTACKGNATIISDEFKSYGILDSRNSNRLHLKVNHSVAFSDDGVHTNNVESFWATLKRGIYGIYHQVSAKYLQDYVNEFSFRWNYRNTDIFSVLMARTIAA